ncbi:NAD(P)-binding protein [Streptomyces sp. NPDC058330]|uniref:NAD(P)-binding protein n=1 Tax=Streptomyces sp. NPDC058330 TaxID=3346449 RepID=UPI0036E47539
MSDAPVIGGGPDGLVAANLLADAGRQVTVLQAQDEPGGAVRSDRTVHPDKSYPEAVDAAAAAHDEA